MRPRIFMLLTLGLIGVPAVLWAHPGGLDTNGCHSNSTTRMYECHEGAQAGRAFATREDMERGIKGRPIDRSDQAEATRKIKEETATEKATRTKAEAEEKAQKAEIKAEADKEKAKTEAKAEKERAKVEKKAAKKKAEAEEKAAKAKAKAEEKAEKAKAKAEEKMAR
jgi:hypothetical protein